MSGNTLKVKIFCFLYQVIFFVEIQSYAETYYQLMENITFPSLISTKVYSSDRLFLCYNQQLSIYNLSSGQLTNSISFASVSAGSVLDCFDAYLNNTYCLMNKGTIIIRYDVATQLYNTYDNSVTKTSGKLALGGLYSITNSPTTAQVYIFNYYNSNGIFIKPLAATTADYSIQVDIHGDRFAVFQSRRYYFYSYNNVSTTWSLANSTALTPIVGSTIYFMAFSPKGDVYYNSRGNTVIQIRNATDYSVISQITYVGLTAANVQFTNTKGDQLSIHLYNATSNSSYLQLLNTTTNVSTYKNMSGNGSTSSFQSMKIYPSQRIMILFYSTFGCQIYQLKCPIDSIYSDQQGICLYCNQTDLCPGPAQNNTNVTNSTNATNASNATNLTNSSYSTNLTAPLNNTYLNNTSNNSTSNNSSYVPINNQSNSSNLPSNNTTNLTNTSQQKISPSLSNKNIANFTALQTQMIEISGRFYSIPTIRQSLKSFSYLFLAIDSLWMYDYHNRTYGNQVQGIFQAVRKIQDVKFAFLSMFQFGYQILTNTQMEVQLASNYVPYTSTQYFAAQDKDGSFISNTIDFIMFNIPCTLIVFVLCRFVFFRLANFEISSLFKLYKFWGYFIVCLLQPNVQYFAFLLGNQFHLSFYFTSLNKILNLLWIICLFFIVLLSVSMLYTLKYLYDNHVRLFMENTNRVGWGYAWIIFTVTIKRIFTGMTHSYMYYYPNQQIICLICAEVFQLAFMFFLWQKIHIFKENIGVCARMLMNLIMITFQFSILLSGFLSDRILQNLMDKCMYSIIFALFCNSLVFCILTIFSSIIEKCIQAKKKQQQEKKAKSTIKMFKNNLELRLKQQRKQTTISLKPQPQTQKMFSAKPKITLKAKSKFNIGSRLNIRSKFNIGSRLNVGSKAAIQIEKQFERKGTMIDQYNTGGYSCLKDFKNSQQVSPAQTLGNQRSLVSLKLSRNNSKVNTLISTNKGFKSGVDIANHNTCGELNANKKNKLFSSKKIKSTHHISRTDLQKKPSQKFIKSINQASVDDDIIFSPKSQIQGIFKSIKDIIVEDKGTQIDQN